MSANRIICLFIVMLPFLVKAQDYMVESFDIVPTDLTARTNGRVDNNGRKCGLIKVYVNDAITATDGPVIGEVIDRGLEKWVYVSHDSKQIQLLFKEHMPLRITFDDFNFSMLSGNMTYVLKLREYVGAEVRSESVIYKHEQNNPIPIQTASSIKSNPYDSTSNFQETSSMSKDKRDMVIQNLIDNMIHIEGGTFMMGTDDKHGFDDEKPAHLEKIESFLIGKYEVSQKEWEAVMGNNPSKFKGDNLPVEQVSWDACQEFIRKLNELTGLNFRLPTEEEWEYAAHGGNGYKYAGKTIKNVAWYDKNSRNKTHDIGTKEANEFGLYDLSGNVWEWTSSKWSKNYHMPRDSKNYVYKGGGWLNDAESCRITVRGKLGVSDSSSYLGLRLAL